MKLVLGIKEREEFQKYLNTLEKYVNLGNTEALMAQSAICSMITTIFDCTIVYEHGQFTVN